VHNTFIVVVNVVVVTTQFWNPITTTTTSNNNNKMKIVALVSGGKDSIYAIHCATILQNHELIACVHLSKPQRTATVPTTTTNDTADTSNVQEEEEEEESYMYQTAGSEVVAVQIEECLNVPCIVHPRTGRSIQTGLVYQQHNSKDGSDSATADHDEVEDLYDALHLALQLYPEIAGVCCGAILSNYQRIRVEYVVCQRLRLYSLAYLWRKQDQSNLLAEMLQKGQISAVLVKTAAPPGLLPHRHLRQNIQSLYPSYFHHLYNLYQFHICGEGGEYESLVLDAYIFQKRLVLDRVSVHEDIDDPMIGTLQIHEYHTETKNNHSNRISTSSTITDSSVPSSTTIPTTNATRDTAPALSTSHQPPVLSPTHSQHLHSKLCVVPHIRQVRGGLYSISEIMFPKLDDTNNTDSIHDMALLLQEEIQSIFQLLQQLLLSIHCTAQDVMMVHVYVSDISHFTMMNQYYRDFFGTLLPPSRSTVGSMLKNCHFIMDCMVQCGSGVYMRHDSTANIPSSIVSTNPYAHAGILNNYTKLRDVLHVQSISYWAPVCIGPYSQVNTLRNCIHFCSGQIGLDPPTMQLCHATSLRNQLYQSCTNVANVLDALDACALHTNVLSCLLFVADTAFPGTGCTHTDEDENNIDWHKLSNMCYQQMMSNGGVIPGRIDGLNLNSTTPSNDDVYEDEETRLEVEKNRPSLDGDDNIHATADTTKNTAAMLCPILVVSIPQMPMGALCELEVVAASRRATNALHITNHRAANVGPLYLMMENAPKSGLPTMNWDTGHDFHIVASNGDRGVSGNHVTNGKITSGIQIDSYFRCLGSHTTTCALITARRIPNKKHSPPPPKKDGVSPTCSSSSSNGTDGIIDGVDLGTVLRSMLTAVQHASEMDIESVLHLRLYYLSSMVADGWFIRHALQSAMLYGAFFTDRSTIPATTVIPVTYMGVLFPNVTNHATHTTSLEVSTNLFLTMQIISIDPIRTEQSVWIHEQR
jgi:diphthine-ammonia ligase